MNIKALEILKNLKAIQELESAGAEIFLVGGIVRDHFLGKESKDIDIVVRALPLDQIEGILKKHGFCKQEGENFPVLKFKPKNWIMKQAIDVALPRKDRKATEEELKTLDKRSRGIVAKCDPMLTIEDDLIRRDFTVNSIAVKLDGTIIDPFNGIQDIEDKILRATSLDAFIEDPLRMVRLIQFASRFEFGIETETLELLKQHKSKVQTVSKERFLEEFRKIFEKGNIPMGIDLLRDLDLDQALFGFKNTAFVEHIKNIKTEADFFFCVLSNNELKERKKFLFKSNFKGSKKTAAEIEAIQMGVETVTVDAFKSKKLACQMFQTSQDSFKSGIVNPFVKEAIREILDMKLPLHVNSLKITGPDLEKMGLFGKQVGDAKRKLLDAVLNNEVKNKKEDLLSFIS